MMDISIIICVYNPEERIFARCLRAIHNLDVSHLAVELIVIDNNSSPALFTQEYIAGFMKTIHFKASIVIEAKQGLSFARITGFKAATAPLVIMFDDDNEPERDYLQQTMEIMAHNSRLGIVGPGIVLPNYLDETPAWIKERLGSYFQEKTLTEPRYTSEKAMWHNYYPPGTGQVIRRQVVEAYLRYFESGKARATDRSGQSLASAGDSQIIWSSLNAGLQVGQHPALKVTHLIPGKRSNKKYLMKLSYALSWSGKIAFVEMYPEMDTQLINYRWYKYVYHQAKTIFKAVRSADVKMIPINLASLNGEYEASFQMKKRPAPWLHKMITSFFL